MEIFSTWEFYFFCSRKQRFHTWMLARLWHSDSQMYNTDHTNPDCWLLHTSNTIIIIIVVAFNLYSHVWVGGGFCGDFILSATWNAQWRKSADLEGLLGSKNLFLQWSLQMSDELENIYMCSIMSQYVEFTQTKLFYNFPLDRSFLLF